MNNNIEKEYLETAYQLLAKQVNYPYVIDILSQKVVLQEKEMNGYEYVRMLKKFLKTSV